MSIPYETFYGAFLEKIAEYDLLQINQYDREDIVESYLKRAVSAFKKNCLYNLSSNADDENKEYTVDIPSEEVDEIVDIISEGMVVQWLKPYVYQQELLENAMNTKDFTTYSPAELLYRVGNAYSKCQKDYLQMIREYSYNHGDLTDLHL